MKRNLLFAIIMAGSFSASAQNVGIGTNEPQARLHVADSSVLFSGESTAEDNYLPTPVSGAGTRMMWLPRRAAFRSGKVTGAQWDAGSIGFASFASGIDNIASAPRSTAFGFGSIAAGENSFAQGSSAQANGFTSFAAGYYSKAEGSHSVAIGYASTASANSATVLGAHNNALGNYSFAAGHQTEAEGAYSVGIGRNARAVGEGSSAFGNMASAIAPYSTAMGVGTTANNIYETSLGTFNSILNGSKTSWIATDPLFAVGNGQSIASRSTALMILKNGNTGIGVLNPRAKLQVNGQALISRTSSTNNAHLELEETQLGDGARIRFSNPNAGTRAWELYGLPNLQNPQDAFFNIYYSHVGDVMMLRGNGNVWFRGSVSQNSDASLKTNITPIAAASKKIGQINGYNYFWKDSTRDQSLQAGVLAQEIEAIMPELVTTDVDGIKSVNYIGLIPYLIEAIKEQQKEIEALKNKK